MQNAAFIEIEGRHASTRRLRQSMTDTAHLAPTRAATWVEADTSDERKARFVAPKKVGAKAFVSSLILLPPQVCYDKL